MKKSVVVSTVRPTLKQYEGLKKIAKEGHYSINDVMKMSFDMFIGYFERKEVR